MTIQFSGQGVPLSAQVLDYVSGNLAVDLPAIWAVLSVETSGCGFLPDRRPKILFERHKFHDLTQGRFDAVAPDVSDRTAGGYGAAGSQQYVRLDEAMRHDEGAALRSASWGLGQIMGFNAESVGYESATAMIEVFRDSEDHQIGAMMAFIEKTGLQKAMRSGDWATFAYSYNGKNFHKNGYDTKLATFHARYSAGPLPDLRVRWAQMALTFLGVPGVGSVDGWFGSNTQQALLQFQQARQMSESGQLDVATAGRLAQELGWMPLD